MDMNPAAVDPLAYKDGIMFSGHKFIGGPGAHDDSDAEAEAEH